MSDIQPSHPATAAAPVRHQQRSRAARTSAARQDDETVDHCEVNTVSCSASSSSSSWRDGRKLAAGAGAVAGLAAALACLLLRQRRRACSRRREPEDGRIPLPDLIRYKERQWFVEELENARDADPNAMLRLAKMYLHGQGCQRNIALAQEWVRKARAMGVPATLDELYATDDPDPRRALRQRAAAEERRRQARRAAVPTVPYAAAA